MSCTVDGISSSAGIYVLGVVAKLRARRSQDTLISTRTSRTVVIGHWTLDIRYGTPYLPVQGH